MLLVNYVKDALATLFFNGSFFIRNISQTRIMYSLYHGSFDFHCCSYLPAERSNILLFTTSRRYLFLSLFKKKFACTLCCLHFIEPIVFNFTLFLVYYTRVRLIIPKLCQYYFLNIILSYVRTYK